MMEDYGVVYDNGFNGGMGYPGGCMPMDNIGFSGSEVIGNELPSSDVAGGEATVDINEDVDLDLDDIKMPKMKFKQPKVVKPKAATPVRRFSSNHGGSWSIFFGFLVGIAIFLILYFFVIKD